MATIIDRYTDLTGGSPTPGGEPWPASVARIGALVPARMADRGPEFWGGYVPDGLAALALGNYALAAESGRPPADVNLEEVKDSLRAPGSRDGRISQAWAIHSWTARLAALGHDPSAGIRWPRERPAREGEPAYTLTCFDDVDRAYGRAGDPSTKLPGPVDAVWLNLRGDCSPGDLDNPMVETSFVRMGSVLLNAVGPALAALSCIGADVPGGLPSRPRQPVKQVSPE